MNDVVLLDRSTKVTKEINEVGEAFKDVVANYKKAKEDGWQPGEDIPAVLMASYKSLLAAFDNLGQAKVEAKHEPFKASLGAVIPIVEGVDLLLEKDEEASA